MLTFNLKKEWFEKIKSGEKTHEYREVKDYWEKRFLKAWDDSYNSNNRTKILADGLQELIGAKIAFKLGYPKVTEREKILYAIVTDIKKLATGINTDLKIDKPVYDIEFELIKEKGDTIMKDRFEDEIFEDALKARGISLYKNQYERATYKHTCTMCGKIGNIVYRKIHASHPDTPYLFICDDCYEELTDGDTDV